MKEIKDIVKAFRFAEKDGKRAALATVVKVEGSSYRRPGARMLVTEDGILTGAISGGCLEGDALRKAIAAILQNENKLVVYDSMDEDDAQFGVQLGCNGIVHILFEPIDSSKSENPIALLESLLQSRIPAVLVTMYAPYALMHPGTCLLYRENATHTLLSPDVTTQLLPGVTNAFQKKYSDVGFYRLDDVDFHAFIEFIPPPPSLVIAGAGNDVIPVTEMAAVLGWDVTVADGRPGHATAARFPKATRVLVSSAPDLMQHITVDDRTVFVLMTHNYNYDLALLKQLNSCAPCYIGVLGPKKKAERLLTQLSDSNILFSPGQLKLFYGPTGLNIGAETSEEIALSILAEIKAVLSDRDGTALRNIIVPIHGRSAIDQ